MHRGMLTVGRKGDGVVVAHADGTRYGGAPRPAEVDIATDVFQALRGLGFRDGEVRPVLDGMRTELGALPEKQMLQEALKRLGAKARTYVIGSSGAGRVGEAEVGYGRPTWDVGFFN